MGNCQPDPVVEEGIMACANEPEKGKTTAKVKSWTLSNANGVSVTIMEYGATVTSIKCRDKHKKPGEVVLGYKYLDGYKSGDAYLGCLAGRCANRIAKGEFELENKQYKLATNCGPNHLHGGENGFDKQLWKGEKLDDGCTVRLTLESPGGSEGYPGKLSVAVEYSLDNDNNFTIKYEATTDKTTIVNLTNHSYFNLAGKGHCLKHQVQFKAERYIPIDSFSIPTGEIAPVKLTPFDFSKPKPMGQDIDSDHEQTKLGLGYDHCYVLHTSNSAPDEPELFALVYEEDSGRHMKCYTTEPGFQFYSGNYLGGDPKGYPRRAGFCLETQHFPNSINQPGWPSVILQPGNMFKSTTVYQFGVGCPWDKGEDEKDKKAPSDEVAPQAEDVKVDPANAEPAKEEPPKAEQAKEEPPKAEQAKEEPPKAEPAKAEPAKVEPAKAEPEKVEPANDDAPKQEPAKDDAEK